jgi:hypothetical protein
MMLIDEGAFRASSRCRDALNTFNRVRSSIFNDIRS